MILGTYTFAREPADMTIPRPKKAVAYLKTYDSVACFSWDPTIVGELLTLRWPIVSKDQFEEMDDIYQAAVPVTFDPTSLTMRGESSSGDGSLTFIVEVIDLRGSYTLGFPDRRSNCELDLLIIGVNT